MYTIQNSSKCKSRDKALVVVVGGGTQSWIHHGPFPLGVHIVVGDGHYRRHNVPTKETSYLCAGWEEGDLNSD